jgi:N-acetyl sugar amidotransferase
MTRPVQQCVRCLYTSDHPLGITFDDEGVCSGCRVHEEKDRLDWGARWTELEALVAPYRTHGKGYDCIVPVSGPNDSHFILHVVVNRLKLKPLVVSYNKYFNTPLGIANLANLRIKFNVDFLQKNVDPRVVRKITRTALYRHGNMYWHCLAGQTVFPVQTAVQMKLPLIIWGAHQGLEQVGMFSHLDNVEMTRRYRKDHDLFDQEADDLVGDFDDLREEEVANYRYPSFGDLNSVGVRGIYLGNYVRWDPTAQHRSMVELYGYRGQPLARTFDGYDHIDCFNYANVHDLLKVYKHGYGKVTDQASREIRHGRLTRDVAQRLVAHHEGREPEHIDLFCEWLGTNPQALSYTINRHRNPKIWQETAPNVWKRRSTVPVTAGAVASPLGDRFKDPPIDPRSEDRRYIIVGKGVDWPSPVDKPQVTSWL